MLFCALHINKTSYTRLHSTWEIGTRFIVDHHILSVKDHFLHSTAQALLKSGLNFQVSVGVKEKVKEQQLEKNQILLLL